MEKANRISIWDIKVGETVKGWNYHYEPMIYFRKTEKTFADVI